MTGRLERQPLKDETIKDGDGKILAPESLGPAIAGRTPADLTAAATIRTLFDGSNPVTVVQDRGAPISNAWIYLKNVTV